MRVEPFEADHLRALVLQPHQSRYQAMLASGEWAHLAIAGQAWTGLVGSEVVGCAGLLDLGGGRAEAWALLGAGAGPVMVKITRAVRRGFALSSYRYVQAHTAVGFEPGARWARMLGFSPHAPALPGYCDDGSDAILWTRALGPGVGK